jgi:hypothetical protein
VVEKTLVPLIAQLEIMNDRDEMSLLRPDGTTNHNKTSKQEATATTTITMMSEQIYNGKGFVGVPRVVPHPSPIPEPFQFAASNNLVVSKMKTKLDKVTSNIQKDLTITNKNMAKIHSVLKTHVTEDFMDARFTAMTNHLTNCFQTALHQSRSHSVEEELNEYMNIDEDDDSSKRKLDNSISLPDNKKKIGKENNGTAKKTYP